MKYSARTAIMNVFEQIPNEEISSMEFYFKARDLGVFVPPAFNTHLSQLHALKKIKRVRRGVYVLEKKEEAEKYIMDNSILK